MCDRRDKNQELLEKLSRQLSELTPTRTSNLDEELANDLGNQWAQPTGPPCEENHNTFSSLYTWNPAFLESSSAPTPHHSCHTFPSQDSPLVSPGLIPQGGYNFPGNISSWNSDIPPFNQDFKIVRDPIIGYSNAPTASDQHFDSQLGNSHVYRQREPHFQHNSSLVGSGFLTSHPKEPASLSSLGNHSPTFNSHHQNLNPLHAPANSQHIFRGGVDSFCNTNNSSESIEGSFFDPAPPFDPSTPPPSFSFQRSHSQPTDNTDHRPTDSLPVHNEFLEFLRLNSESPINLDFVSTIGSSENWQAQPVEKNDVSETGDGKQLYAEALSKWNSFDFSGIDSSNDVPENFSAAETFKDQPSESGVIDLGKPSYSDIAKTPVAAPSGNSRSSLSGSANTATKASVASKGGKPYRPLIQRTISASKIWPKGNSNFDPKVSPTSRYGLDNFDDGIQSSGIEGKYHETVENVAKTKRSGSSGSILHDRSEEMTGQNVTLLGDNAQIHESKSKMKPDQNTKSGETQSKLGTSSSKAPNLVSSGIKSEERLFFDPKRIFQSKHTNKPKTQSPNVNAGLKHGGNDKSTPGETVLNNGKPNTTSSSFKLPNARQHDYINNDLRDTNKVTNKTAAEGVNSSHISQGNSENLHDKSKESSRPQYGKRSGSGRASGSFHREKRKVAEHEPHQEQQQEEKIDGYFMSNENREKMVQWLTVSMEKIIVWSKELLYRAFTLILCAVFIALKLSYNLFCLLYVLVVKAFNKVKARIFGRDQQQTNENAGWNARDSVRRRVGLEENIVLPSTGEEAMKRLLACKGKDPYSILGLRQDSSDEDIKKYYKKQAVLVHPDKNQSPGSEEAFKILGHAFDKIGEASKRKEYDSQALYESEYELRREFADLLTKLQTKLQEAANMMPCDQCGNKHQRVPVDREVHFARYCEEHKIRHPAKEGDVWAETSMLGFYWHYYSVMEGCVYDITEWMKCQEQLYKKMEANEHRVGFKISTVSMKKSKHQQASEANIEDLINRIFPKTPGYPGSPPSQNSAREPSSSTYSNWGQSFPSSSSSSASTSSAKKTGGGGRRKKRKH